MKSTEFIERRIICGLIVSEEYAKRIVKYWQDGFLDTPELQKIARWCVDYYNQYDTVPLHHIEDIYMDEMSHERLTKPEAEMIEAILKGISDEYDRGEHFNAEYLWDRTIQYFRQREQAQYIEDVEALTERGEVEEADERIRAYKPLSFITTLGIEVFSDEGYAAIENAFSTVAKPVVRYPGAFGTMVNSHLIRGGFVAFLAPEKRGKTWLMLDMALRALRESRSNVAFFQAGDLTEAQMLRRVCIHLSGRSDDPTYCQEYWRPVGDCVRNQFDNCTRADRNCAFGVYDDGKEAFWDDIEHYQDYDNLKDVALRNRDYKPCDSATCIRDGRATVYRQGTVWLKKEREREPLGATRAIRVARAFFDEWRRRFKLKTDPSDTLSCDDIKRTLDEWEYADNFVPDVIIIDYADLMAARGVAEFRHRQDAIWKGLRGISQERHALVVTATQADAASYKQDHLGLQNFSEDKRKYAHVTAMWGLNQDKQGREKKLGIMRINELVVREGIFDINNEVAILQDLRSGRPFLESYNVPQWR